MKCEGCGEDIPQARLDALPTTKVCVTCSTEEPVQGLLVWDGKHTPILQTYERGKMPEDRKGFHAQLPFNSTNNPRMVKSMANLNLSDQVKLKPPEEYTVTDQPPARCHPGSPRVTPDGKCLECALAYYKRRLRR